jgi:hypothetical protein
MDINQHHRADHHIVQIIGDNIWDLHYQ